MRFKTFTILFIFLCEYTSYASYRVYKLKIKQENKPYKIVITNLDNYQYSNYYNLGPKASIELLDTWYCPGDTSKKPICAKPKNKPNRGPASTNGNYLPYSHQPIIPR